MFCGKCGVQNEEDAKFCCNCGAPLGTPETPVPESSTASTPKQKHRAIGITAVAVAAVAVIILLMVFLPGSGYKKPVSACMDAALSGNHAVILKYIPPEILESALKESGKTPEELLESYGEISEELEDLRAFLGENVQIDYKVLGGVDLSPEKLESLQADYLKEGVKIKDAKSVAVEITVHVGSFSNTSLQDVPVVKSHGRWYLDVLSFNPFR